ncbi:Hypothetical protein FKW44_019247, partial [Caligus rogercresseyi]
NEPVNNGNKPQILCDQGTEVIAQIYKKNTKVLKFVSHTVSTSPFIGSPYVSSECNSFPLFYRDILFKQFQYIKQEPLEQEEECIVQPQDSAAVPLGGPTSSQSESPSKSISNVVEGSFNISLELREALCALPGFKKDQTLFQYNEVRWEIILLLLR